jgi:RNA polymerase sigma-32 factor
MQKAQIPMKAATIADAVDPGEAFERGPFVREPSDRRSGLAAYLADIRRHPVMSRDEEQRVATEYVTTRDQRLANRLVAANLRLVLKIALEYRSARGNLLDLVQEGNMGLVHAVQKFDPLRGVRLATYASWWMRAYMLKFILSNARLVKVGTTQAQRRLFFGLSRERGRLEGRDGENVDARQLAAVFNVREQDVVDMERRLAGSEASLDTPARRGPDGSARGEIVVPTEESARPDVQYETRELNEAIALRVQAFRRTLTGRDAVIFEGRLATDSSSTLAEIATSFGLSRERVRQLEERLKSRLRADLCASFGDAVSPPDAVRAPQAIAA